jgi:hypothetical protein
VAANKKLTKILQGRTVQSVSDADNRLTVEFHDGSKLTVKVGDGEKSGTPVGLTVKGVRQKDTRLNLDFTDGSVQTVPLAEETSSVMLRDANGVLEYAD